MSKITKIETLSTLDQSYMWLYVELLRRSMLKTRAAELMFYICAKHLPYQFKKLRLLKTIATNVTAASLNSTVPRANLATLTKMRAIDEALRRHVDPDKIYYFTNDTKNKNNNNNNKTIMEEMHEGSFQFSKITLENFSNQFKKLAEQGLFVGIKNEKLAAVETIDDSDVEEDDDDEQQHQQHDTSVSKNFGRKKISEVQSRRELPVGISPVGFSRTRSDVVVDADEYDNGVLHGKRNFDAISRNDNRSNRSKKSKHADFDCGRDEEDVFDKTSLNQINAEMEKNCLSLIGVKGSQQQQQNEFQTLEQYYKLQYNGMCMKMSVYEQIVKQLCLKMVSLDNRMDLLTSSRANVLGPQPQQQEPQQQVD